MKKISVLIVVLVLTLGFQLLFGSSVRADEHPNVIVFLSDDQGYGDFSYTGNKDIELEKGQGKLVLKALEIPGDESIEFRLLMLTRVK